MATRLDELMGVDIAHKSDFQRKADGDLETITGLENYKLALFHRIMTTPGSLIHRPNYGVGIKDFQGSPATRSVQRKLALRIKEQLELDPRTEEVLGISFNVDDLSPEKTSIIVRVKPVGYDEAAITVTPFGDEGIS